jgi:YidC/Oxa1 family membrane protein insertase
MDTNRNTLLAIALSLLVLLGWQFLYVSPKMEAERKAAEIARMQEAERQSSQPATQPGAQTGAQPGTGIAPAAQPGNAVPGTSIDVPGSDAARQETDRNAVLARTQRLPVENSDIIGSVNLKGARVDDLQLKNYRVTIERNSPLVTLLSPSELKEGYFAEFGWVGSAASGEVPGPDTVWTAPAGAKLTPQTPVTLSWTNPAGTAFTRTIAVDDHYMFTVTDKVVNGAAAEIGLAPYGRVTRFEQPVSQANYVLHEGMIGVFGEEGLQEVTYSNIQEDRAFTSAAPVSQGWLGITDKYWATTMVPAGQYKPRFSFFDDGRTRFQADFLGEEIKVAPGQSAEVAQQLFAGAKEVNIIDGYEAQHGIKNFELMIDWGWFYFITKPMFWLLDFIFDFFGNFGVAILLATVLIKALLYPLANMSYRSMANMKKMQPEMLAIRERFPDDKVKQQQEMMALYKREKINPAAGCWPVLVQIPIFFALYKVLFITIEMRHAPFFGWIQDLAAPDPTSIFNLFGLLPFAPPAILPVLGIWPVIMGITMFVQMQMNPAPPDPTQAMIFKWMPLVFTFMLGTFPAGLVIYWAWNNTLSVIQQGVIMKRQGAKIELWDNLKAMFARKPAKPAE